MCWKRRFNGWWVVNGGVKKNDNGIKKVMATNLFGLAKNVMRIFA